MFAPTQTQEGEDKERARANRSGEREKELKYRRRTAVITPASRARWHLISRNVAVLSLLFLSQVLS